jgi:hypothetical protein
VEARFALRHLAQLHDGKQHAGKLFKCRSLQKYPQDIRPFGQTLARWGLFSGRGPMSSESISAFFARPAMAEAGVPAVAFRS